MKALAAIAMLGCASAPAPDYVSGATLVYWGGSEPAPAELDDAAARLKAKAPCRPALRCEVVFHAAPFPCGVGAQVMVNGCLPQGPAFPLVAVVYRRPFIDSALVDELGHIAWIECTGDSGSTWDASGKEHYSSDFQSYLDAVRRP